MANLHFQEEKAGACFSSYNFQYQICHLCATSPLVLFHITWNFLICGQTTTSIEVSGLIGVKFNGIGLGFLTKTDILGWFKMSHFLLPYYHKFLKTIFFFVGNALIQRQACDNFCAVLKTFFFFLFFPRFSLFIVIIIFCTFRADGNTLSFKVHQLQWHQTPLLLILSIKIVKNSLNKITQ